jgi:hypothetical protein
MEQIKILIADDLKAIWEISRSLVTPICYRTTHAIDAYGQLQASFKKLDSFSIGQIRWLVENIPAQIMCAGPSVFKCRETNSHIMIIETEPFSIKVTTMPGKPKVPIATLWRKSKLVDGNGCSPSGWDAFDPQDYIVYT